MSATINTLPNCAWCVKAKQLLDLFGIPYRELDGKVDSWPTVPYIVVDGKEIGGYVELAQFCRKL